MDEGYLLAARFWSKVEVGEVDDCWLWLRGRFPNTYGSFRYKGRAVGSHRIAFLLATGALPSRLACHHCNNRLCCNPRHIYDGTPKQNKADSIRVGTSYRGGHAMVGKAAHGEAHGHAKLTRLQVVAIRERALIVSVAQVAREYQTPYGTIHAIVTGKNRRYESTTEGGRK